MCTPFLRNSKRRSYLGDLVFILTTCLQICMSKEKCHVKHDLKADYVILPKLWAHFNEGTHQKELSHM